MSARRSAVVVSVLGLSVLLSVAACVMPAERETEAHAADTRSKDEQATRIERKDQKDGPKDTTPVVGQDSVKIDGG
jgi:hypothetical protein